MCSYESAFDSGIDFSGRYFLIHTPDATNVGHIFFYNLLDIQ